MVVESFGNLFKKYRLKSEFKTLCEFGMALAEEGRVYDNSIFTRWQNGKRIPRDRLLLISILKIFVLRGGITSLDVANEFLASAGLGYLTKQEQKIFTSYLRNNINSLPLELNML